MTSAAWRPDGDGVVLALRVTPRAGRDAVGGLRDTGGGAALELRVRAAASDGAANEAVLRLLAERLGVPKRAVALKSGAASRLKLARIDGPPDAIIAALARLVAEAA